MEEEWKAAAMEDAQKVCDLTDLTTELAEALEGVLRIVSAYSLSQGLGQNQLKRVEQAKAVLKKAGR